MQALAIYERLAKTNPQNFEPELARTQNNLGTLYCDQNDFVLAEKAFMQALEVRERLAKTNPQAFESDLAKTQNNLGALYFEQNDFGLAEKAYGQALAIYERLAKTNPDAYEIEWCNTVVNLGLLQKADFQIARQESLQTQLASAQQKLQQYSGIPLATQLLQKINELQVDFRTRTANSAGNIKKE